MVFLSKQHRMSELVVTVWCMSVFVCFYFHLCFASSLKSFLENNINYFGVRVSSANWKLLECRLLKYIRFYSFRYCALIVWSAYVGIGVVGKYFVTTDVILFVLVLIPTWKFTNKNIKISIHSNKTQKFKKKIQKFR